MPTTRERKRDREAWWSIHDKDTYVCPDCHRPREEHDRQWEVHHIGGEPGNIVGLCAACHDIRHGADPESVDIAAWKAAFVGESTDGVREDRRKNSIGDIEVYSNILQ